MTAEDDELSIPVFDASGRHVGYRLTLKGEEALRSGAALHCPTCQCARINSPAFVLDNKNSRSWHGNAPNSPEEANKG